MHPNFTRHLTELPSKFDQLINQEPASVARLPKDVPAAGIYLLSEGDVHLYVGRTNKLKQRLTQHGGKGASHNTASFAYRLACLKLGRVERSYIKGHADTRSERMRDPEFLAAFKDQKERIRSMDVRYVGEDNPIRQALLEIYASEVLVTPHNSFDNH